MTSDSGSAGPEEVTVEMPVAMLDRVEELRAERGYGSRGQVVADAIRRAAGDE